MTKEQMLENKKQYYEANKEKIKEKARLYREANKEKIKEKARLYREANKEKIKETNNKFYNKNKEKVKLNSKVAYIKNKDKRCKYQKNKNHKRILEIANQKIAQGNNGNDYIFYLLKFIHKKSNLEFYKFGITKFNVKERYRNYSLFNYDIICEITGSKEFIKAIEKKVKYETLDYIIELPENIGFHSGYTECRKLDVNILEKVKKLNIEGQEFDI